MNKVWSEHMWTARGVKTGIKREARQRGKSQGVQRADGSRRKEHEMSGGPPGAQRGTRAVGQGDAHGARASYQWLGQRIQATWGRHRRGDGPLARKLILSRYTRLGRKTRAKKRALADSVNWGHPEGTLRNELRTKATQTEESASSSYIPLCRIPSLKGHEKVMVSCLFSGGTTNLLPLRAMNWFCFSRSWVKSLLTELCLTHPPAPLMADPYNVLDVCLPET